MYETRAGTAVVTGHVPGRDERIRAGMTAVKEIVGRVWPYLLAGIVVGAGIHGYVPGKFMAAIVGRRAWWSVPLAVLVGCLFNLIL